MGQLGSGEFDNADTPVPVALSSTVTSMAVALASTCVALASGDLACWGLNEHGEFGNGEGGNNVIEPSPVEVSLGFPIDQVSGTYGHTCVRLTIAEAACFGYNLDGQLGNGTQDDSTTPVGVMGEGVQEIVAGDGHTCGRTGAGLACWGSNNNGQLGLGSTGPDVLTETAVTAVADVTRIELSDNFSCIVDTSDELVCWGRNVEGEMGNGQSGANTWQLTPFTVPIGPIVDVALGYRHTCALTTGGEVLCWGLNNHGQLGTGDTSAHDTPQPVVW
jgi:alpha-tubulin suppressor-like RCC1 family protein